MRQIVGITPQMPTSAEKVYWYLIHSKRLDSSAEERKAEILEQIELAQKEAYLEGFQAYRTSEEAVKERGELREEGYDRGFAEARERAAKVVEDQTVTWQETANTIRALKPTEGGCK